MLGGGHGSGPRRSSGTPWELGTKEQGLFHCPWMLCSLHPRLACRGPAPSLGFFFKTERTHTKKPITQPSAPKGKKKPQANVGSGEKCSLIIHEGWLGRSRPLQIPTYQPELLLLPKRAPFICFRLLH